jgi:SAM-dependent methyltransferase
MDEITKAVRDMYEQYPYPAGAPAQRVATDVRSLLSYVERSRGKSGRLQVLDAGCGRGVGTLGCAVLQPDVDFLGVDISRVALKDSAEQAKARGLNNVRFQECDLMTLGGLQVPPGGFDVIYSSGVLHHLSDPVAGLVKLREILAPHGVVSLMVYARHGRAPLSRLVQGIDILVPRKKTIPDRMKAARLLAAFAKTGILGGTPWADTPEVKDIEFVDRCLNVNETSFDIQSMWELLAKSGMGFIRWAEPADWSVEAVFKGELREVAAGLDEIDRYKLIEQVCWRPSLELMIAGEDNLRRKPLQQNEVDPTFFAVNPEVSFHAETRNLHGLQRVESISYKLRLREIVQVPKGALGTAVFILRDQNLPFTGKAFAEIMEQKGIPPDQARAVLMELLERDVLYRPHRSEI